MTPSIAEILDRSADLIEPEGAWIQGSFARTAKGNFTAATNRYAVCWCATGAIAKAARGNGALIRGAARVLDRLIHHDSIWEWNDSPSRKQAQVVAKLREAASKAREVQQ